MPLTYRDAGVGHREQEELNRAALAAVKRSLERMGLRYGGVGGYAAWAEVPGLGRLSLHVDGVGTKTLVLERTGSLWVAGWDCVAMNVNDLAVAGWRPVLLVDYIAAPRPEPDRFAEIVEGIERASERAGVAILGGETAVLPGLAGGYDVVCTVLGVEAPKPGDYGYARPGDVIVGFSSSGLHANGYSLARRIVEERLGGYSYDTGLGSIGELLSAPTLIYSGLVLEAIEKGLIRAAAHLTGGGWAKIARIVPEGASAVLEAPMPGRLFEVLMEAGGVPVEEMYRTFNMGVGLVAAARGREEAEKLIHMAWELGLGAEVIGRVEHGQDGSRVVVRTPYGVTVRFP